MANLKPLDKSCIALLNENIPIVEHAPRTFFDIAGFAHYETVVSNFYAYYFNPQSEHGLGDLFIRAMLSLIPENNLPAEALWSGSVVKREVHTRNGKFIDLVIGIPEERQPEKESEELYEHVEYSTAIIIENKVYAWLYNHLEEYYSSVSARKKKGIVLSLRREVTNHEHFISITHDELLKRVEALIKKESVQLPDRQNLILEEFTTNLRNMTKQADSSAIMQFYHTNQKKIREVLDHHEAVTKILFGKIDNACEMLGLGLELQSRGSSRLRHFWAADGHVYFTVLLEDFIKGSDSFRVFLELDQTGIQFWPKLDRSKLKKEEEGLLKTNPKDAVSYMHIAEIRINPTPEELNNLDQYLVKRIRDSKLASLFVELDKQIRALLGQFNY
jgi:hypothetical protein